MLTPVTIPNQSRDEITDEEINRGVPAYLVQEPSSSRQIAGRKKVRRDRAKVYKDNFKLRVNLQKEKLKSDR